MPNNKKKSLSNIKGLDKAHPYSRKALQIQRALHRDDSISKKKLDRDQHKRLAVERVLWFKFAIPDPPEVTTEADVHAVIDMYINRYEDEIAQIKSQLRKNRPKPGRLDLLESMRAKDLAEYNGGIEVPLMSDIKNVELLKAWEGDHNALANIRMVRVVKPIKELASTGSSLMDVSDSTKIETDDMQTQ